ncbi:hypothetical protein DUI87_15946 [Hirundo rustica rustica]|uniref:Reverse transcriptase domain-containing protein n=1 Tax=Hirundo rustica rustica TaxID=333673 RepID=A0A3M0JZT8_HIRRU|nr:hypothetical protein DUI87_15946 [Hirundo rustica rustica]
MKQLSIIYQESWLTGEVPDDWKLANVTPIHKNGRKEDPGNYRPIGLTSVPGKVMEQFILSVIMQHLQDGQGIRPSQHGFRRGRICFYDQGTSLVDVGKGVDGVYLDFSKALDTVSHSTLLDKLAAHGLDGNTLCWVRNWLHGRAQRVVVNADSVVFLVDLCWGKFCSVFLFDNMNVGIESFTGKFAEDAKLGTCVDLLEGYNTQTPEVAMFLFSWMMIVFRGDWFIDTPVKQSRMAKKSRKAGQSSRRKSSRYPLTSPDWFL